MHDATFVFDLDGTLIDTAPDLLGATNHVLTTAGLAPVSAEALRPWIGYGARRMIVESLAQAGVSAPEADVARMLELFILHYAEHIADHSRPYPGLEAALDECASRGAILAVCTNKREALALALLRALDLDGRFAFIAGRDTFPVSKPHPDHLLNTIHLAGGDPGRAVMVGDSEVDVGTAKAANVPIVAVTFGYSPAPVGTFGPDMTIDAYDRLVPALERVLGGEVLAVRSRA